MVWRPCRYAQRWPELWRPLSDHQRWVLSQALAEDGLADPNRGEIADLAALVAGTLTADEFEQRAEWRICSSAE
jgi:hypothetical protein